MTHAGRTITALVVLACSGAPGLAATPMPHMPARKAFVASPTERPQGCLNGAGLSHAAYLPEAAGKVAGCGHFLSTDTLMTVHRWDRT